MCTEISDLDRNLTVTAPSISRKERYLRMRPFYKQIAAHYFMQRFVDPKDIMDPDQKMGKVIWAAYHVPILVLGMLVNDEVFIENDIGWNQWDPLWNEMLNYKWIQFEYLWDDTLDSMRTIKCWMTQGHRMDNTQCEFERDDPLNQFLFPKVEKTNSNRGGSAPYSDWYIGEVLRLMDPCFRLLVKTMLRDRPNLVLGDWMEWEHFGY